MTLEGREIREAAAKAGAPQTKGTIPAPPPPNTSYSSGYSPPAYTTTTPSGGTVAHGIPEPDQAEFWRVEGKYYVVYYVPNTDPPIPMAWELDGKEELDAIQPGAPVKAWTPEQAKAQGWTLWGKASELTNTTEHPFDAYISLINDQAKVRPWLRDSEVLTLIAQATLEGRAVSEAEFQQTQWWRSRNAQQRAWLLLAESDPKQAARILEDSRFQAETDLMEAGVNDASVEMIEYMATRLTMGDWSSDYYDRQVKAISDPNLGYEIDAAMRKALGGNLAVGTNQQYEDAVRAMVTEWLGPVMGAWSQGDVAKWASRFRNTPDARAELEEELRRQRLALFPEYENPELTYDSIAQPWRAKWNQVWGQTADETDPLFMEILRLNDVTAAGRRLTQEGLNRNIRKVKQEAQQAMDQTFRNNAGVVASR